MIAFSQILRYEFCENSFKDEECFTAYIGFMETSIHIHYAIDTFACICYFTQQTYIAEDKKRYTRLL